MNMLKKGLSFVMALVLLLGLVLPLGAQAEGDIKTLVEESAAYIVQTVPTPAVGSVGGEWAVLALSRAGAEVPEGYYEDYLARVAETVQNADGVLHKRKYTEYSRLTVALTAAGADPTDVAGYDLMMPLGDFEKTIWQGINGPIWALIALDSLEYDVPENAEAAVQATRELYIDEILSRQNNDGGWELTSKGGDVASDPDITAMALQALAKYQDQAAVKAATEKALDCLSDIQLASGGYMTYQEENCESVAQVIVALCELGVDLEDPRFVKNGNTLMDSLLSYRLDNGGFRHTYEDVTADPMSSEQGLYTLVAVLRIKTGNLSLYRMQDRGAQLSWKEKTGPLPGKHEDVKVKPVTLYGVTFSDTGGHKNEEAILNLAKREIIDGMGDGTFAPDATMTRAQFATIIVKALGLQPQGKDNFKDVAADQWYAPYVGTAHTYGIVEGRTDTVFDPAGLISRQEAACMVARAAKLCGMDTERGDGQILNTLSQFGDYVTCADWAKESLAFCYDEGILDDAVLDIEPNAYILRCEIAQMIYDLLTAALLV